MYIVWYNIVILLYHRNTVAWFTMVLYHHGSDQIAVPFFLCLFMVLPFMFRLSIFFGDHYLLLKFLLTCILHLLLLSIFVSLFLCHFILFAVNGCSFRLFSTIHTKINIHLNTAHASHASNTHSRKHLFVYLSIHLHQIILHGIHQN